MTAGGWYGPMQLLSGADGSTFYGQGGAASALLYTLQLSPDGIRIAGEASLLAAQSQRLERHGDRIYSTSGAFVDAAGSGSGQAYWGSGPIEPVGDEVFILTTTGLRIFHETSYEPDVEFPIENPGAWTGELVETAAGFAATTADGQVHLLRFAPAFPDVRTHTHRESIVAVASAGIAAGYTDGDFRPDASVTRGQMATFLVRALGLPPAPAVTFPDTLRHAHRENIGALAAAGITTGFPDGRFRPDAPVTREQMATFLRKALDLPVATAPAPFTDVAGVHAPSVASLHEARIAGGTGGGRFSPGDPVRRGQMATFLARSLDLVERLPAPPG